MRIGGGPLCRTQSRALRLRSRTALSGSSAIAPRSGRSACGTWLSPTRARRAAPVKELLHTSVAMKAGRHPRDGRSLANRRGCRANQGPCKDVPRRLPPTEDRPHRRPRGRRRSVVASDLIRPRRWSLAQRDRRAQALGFVRQPPPHAGLPVVVIQASAKSRMDAIRRPDPRDRAPRPRTHTR
jgi:hypothetical protein